LNKPTGLTQPFELTLAQLLPVDSSLLASFVQDRAGLADDGIVPRGVVGFERVGVILSATSIVSF